LISIVVLTYNQLEECTKSCIESIYKYRANEEFELIVVDNNSQDNTVEYLRSIVSTYPNMTIICNDTNKGYAGGNNDGIRVAKGDYVILLNNDTLVSEGWLKKIVKPFVQDRKVGLVGPISNSVGNEQRVNIEGLSEKNYNEKSRSYTEANEGVIFQTQRLGFFCVAIKKEVIEKIGTLDEKFGIGMFEDDDYCMRAIQVGYTLAVTEECFIYHKGSVSFKKLSTQEYQEIFQRNKNYFFSKHKAQWCLSDIAFAYWGKFSADLKEFQKSNDASVIERISTRMENFQYLLFQIREVEMQKLNINSPIISKEVQKTKWKIRFNNVKEEFLKGSLDDKKRYLKRIACRIAGIDEHKPSDATMNLLREIKSNCTYTKVILFPATIDYFYMKQRPQHLAEAFAEQGYLVIYGTLNHKTDKVDGIQQIGTHLLLMHEHYFPYLSEVFNKDELVYYCLWANNIKHLDYLRYGFLIYDYMDELELLDVNKSLIQKNHNDLLVLSDMITVSADKLAEQIPDIYKEKVLMLKNGVDRQFIEALQEECKIPNEMLLIKKNNYEKIIGYYGAIAEWMDFDLIENCLMELPSYAFIFIGPVFGVEKQVKHLENKFDNIFFIKEMKRDDLIPYLKSFDVCILPFLKNNITDSVSPVKIYEYLAAGKPVVSVNMIECASIPIIDVANNTNEFIYKIINHSIFDGSKTQVFIQANLWSQKVNEICEKI